MSWNSTEALNTTSTHIIQTLLVLKQQLLVYLPIIFIIFGVFGFIGNVFTFLQRTLRHNSCCIYLLCGSLVDFINLFVNLLTNYVHSSTDYILALVTARYVCKLRLFSLVFLPQLSVNFLILSLIDRFACTCSLTSRIRYIRQLDNVPWMIFITIIISGVMSFYAPFYYDIVSHEGCICIDRFWNGALYIICHGFIGPLVMLGFVLITFKNVKRSRHRAGLKRYDNKDQSRKPFIRMIFTHVFTTSFLILQWIAFYTYHLSNVDNLKNDDQRIIHYFTWYVSNNIYYLINVKSFYLSTLTSHLFRKTFLEALCHSTTYFRRRQKHTANTDIFVNIYSRNRTDEQAL